MTQYTVSLDIVGLPGAFAHLPFGPDRGSFMQRCDAGALWPRIGGLRDRNATATHVAETSAGTTSAERRPGNRADYPRQISPSIPGNKRATGRVVHSETSATGRRQQQIDPLE